ncbi:2Fe-2S iron-sulfur cluster binding domain-containing protein [Marinobacterium sp. D7]|uniref:2Fe-2S iron-sulfur cluster-binding protein n=1 Tax=Marinobacterium ramblicola TaxID=2849041 RepID=UPI001C2DC23F|nr:2Fe-2S iron-sulfur cluster-binding protein [Marinobacterium ramblicola]MBV1790739.1 2Fe-2S iron-sulfur cluster binding domain-containing protein [Marinobacterium ramblicola]
MPKVVYVDFQGNRNELEVANGMTLMQGAVMNGLDGIEGECSGSCACATCHCYVDEAYLDKLPEMSENEDELLDGTASERLGSSRLSCQIRMTDDLDGIVVQLPEEQ